MSAPPTRERGGGREREGERGMGRDGREGRKISVERKGKREREPGGNKKLSHLIFLSQL